MSQYCQKGKRPFELISEKNNSGNEIKHIAEITNSTKRKKFIKVDQIDLKQILLDHAYGKSILKCYDIYQELNNKYQAHLCVIIVLYFRSTDGM